MTTLNSWDEALFHLINRDLAAVWLDDPMMFISSKYTWLALGLGVLVATMIARRAKLLHLALLLGATIGLADFVTYHLVKPTVARERPCRQLAELRLVPQWCGGDYGFPSNHATNGMAMTTVLALNAAPSVAVAALVLTLITGFSRVYLGVHFPGDVLAGFIFGGVLGLLCHYCYWWLVHRVATALKGRDAVGP